MKIKTTPVVELLTGEDIVQNDGGLFAVKEFIKSAVKPLALVMGI